MNTFVHASLVVHQPNNTLKSTYFPKHTRIIVQMVHLFRIYSEGQTRHKTKVSAFEKHSN